MPVSRGASFHASSIPPGRYEMTRAWKMSGGTTPPSTPPIALSQRLGIVLIMRLLVSVRWWRLGRRQFATSGAAFPISTKSGTPSIRVVGMALRLGNFRPENLQRNCFISRGLSFGLLSAFFLLLVGWGEAHAQMEERFHIRTLSIEPLKGSRKEAKGIEEKFREALNRTFRLTVVPLGDRDKADGLITGSLRTSKKALVVSVELREMKRRLPVATEVVRIEGSGDEEIEAGLMRLARALASRLPSKGEVTQVNEGQIGIDAGGLQGVSEEGVLSIFRIKGVVRHPFTQEIVEYQRVRVAEARVTSVGEETAGAGGGRSSLPVQKGDLVTFEVSREIANLYQIRRSHTLPRLPDGLPPKGSAPGKRGKQVSPPSGHDSGRGWAQVGWVYLKNRYRFDSSGLNFTRDVDFFPF